MIFQCLKFYSSFICPAKLQETKSCNDFEVRFCCRKHTSSPNTTEILSTTQTPKTFSCKDTIRSIPDSIDSFNISIPSSIGLRCESGIVDDCNASLSTEVLPFRCNGILMFSSNPNRDCGSKCNLSEQRSVETTPIRKGWTRYVRCALRSNSRIFTFFKSRYS